MVEDRKTFTVPDGYEAIRDSEGRATGEIRLTYTTLEAKLAEVTKERDALRTYAHEATKAITGLTIGGSEYFGRRIGEMYTADLPFCVDRIRERMGYRMEELKAKARAEAAEARATALEERVKGLEKLSASLHDEVQFMRKAAKESRSRADRAEKDMRERCAAEVERLRSAVRGLLDCPDIADNDYKDDETHAAERKARAALTGGKDG